MESLTLFENRHRLVVALAILAVLVLASLPARAALDIDFGAAVSIGDDVDVFLQVSGRYFDADRERVDRVHRRVRHPEDVAVAYFIARRAGVGVKVVLEKRDRGHSWLHVAMRLGLDPDVFFVTLPRDPGPPYGKAYGHRKKGKHAKPHTWDLHDDDIRELVVLRMTSDYYGIAAGDVVRRRGEATTRVGVVAVEYRHRHGEKAAPAGHGGPSHGKSHKSHGRGHGLGKGHSQQR